MEQLKAACEANGLRKTGRKQELVDRLSRYDLKCNTQADHASNKGSTKITASVSKYSQYKVPELKTMIKGRLLQISGATKADLIACLEKDDDDVGYTVPSETCIEEYIPHHSDDYGPCDSESDLGSEPDLSDQQAKKHEALFFRKSLGPNSYMKNQFQSFFKVWSTTA